MWVMWKREDSFSQKFFSIKLCMTCAGCIATKLSLRQTIFFSPRKTYLKMRKMKKTVTKIDNVVVIVVLFRFFVCSQPFYLYSKEQKKREWYLFILSIALNLIRKSVCDFGFKQFSLKVCFNKIMIIWKITVKKIYN